MAFRVLSIGEVLWDLLPQGPQPGGAPANFAVHARALGAEARLVSRVGDDPLGRDLLDLLNAAGVETDLIGVDPARPTGTVSMALAEDGQPRYAIHENVAWDTLAAGAAALCAARDVHAVCFGTLAQRRPSSRASVRALVAAVPEGSLKVFDANLRPPFYDREVVESSLALANALKINDAELPVLAGMFGLAGDEKTQLAALTERFRLRVVALTRGARGSLLRVDGVWSEEFGVPVAVRDTVGAGDAFTAAVVTGLLSRWPVPAIHRRASEIASYVCTRTGPTPPLPEFLTTPPTLV